MNQLRPATASSPRRSGRVAIRADMEEQKVDERDKKRNIKRNIKRDINLANAKAGDELYQVRPRTLKSIMTIEGIQPRKADGSHFYITPTIVGAVIDRLQSNESYNKLGRKYKIRGITIAATFDHWTNNNGNLINQVIDKINTHQAKKLPHYTREIGNFDPAKHSLWKLDEREWAAIHKIIQPWKTNKETVQGMLHCHLHGTVAGYSTKLLEQCSIADAFKRFSEKDGNNRSRFERILDSLQVMRGQPFPAAAPRLHGRRARIVGEKLRQLYAEASRPNHDAQVPMPHVPAAEEQLASKESLAERSPSGKDPSFDNQADGSPDDIFGDLYVWPSDGFHNVPQDPFDMRGSSQEAPWDLDNRYTPDRYTPSFERELTRYDFTPPKKADMFQMDSRFLALPDGLSDSPIEDIFADRHQSSRDTHPNPLEMIRSSQEPPRAAPQRSTTLPPRFAIDQLFADPHRQDSGVDKADHGSGDGNH